MYYTETDPLTGEKVYVAKDMKEKSCSGHCCIFIEGKQTFCKALERVGRKDLIDVLK